MFENGLNNIEKVLNLRLYIAHRLIKDERKFFLKKL